MRILSLKHIIEILPHPHSHPNPKYASGTAPGNRVSAIRTAICDTFPEPNRRLLQRILLMMQTIVSRKAENKMSLSAVAACMAPLLLRPLLAGECEIENDFDVGGDETIQLLKAAAAANHAQAIVITLLEEYNSIFWEGSVSPVPDMYVDSEDNGSESEEATDDDLYYDDYYDDEQEESIEESDVDADDDIVCETNSETGESTDNGEYDDEDIDLSKLSSKFSDVSDDLEVDQMLSTTSLEVSLPQCEDIKSCDNFRSQNKTACADVSNKPDDIIEGLSPEQTTINRSNFPSPSSCVDKSINVPNSPTHWRHTVVGSTSARKNLSMESCDHLDEYEAEVERLEAVETELESQVAEEVNAKLQSVVETRKKALQERRLVLEQNIARLQEQLLKEKVSQATLEAGLKFPPGTLSELSGIDRRTKADLEELVLIEADLANLEWKVNELGFRLNAQLEHGSMLNFCNEPQQISSHERNVKNTLDTEVAATSESDRSISKQDSHFVRAVNENERKPDRVNTFTKQTST